MTLKELRDRLEDIEIDNSEDKYMETYGQLIDVCEEFTNKTGINFANIFYADLLNDIANGKPGDLYKLRGKIYDKINELIENMKQEN